jgi:glycosyltransferase involved in cell wall biosynthesis
MKVLVLINSVPFVRGGAEELFDHLVSNLKAAGVEAEGFRIPFSWNPPERIIDEMFIARQTRLHNVDRLIALKFPVYLVPWPDKTIWLLHQFRQAYDLLESGQSNIPSDDRGAEIVKAVRTADNLAFSESRKIFTNSPTTASRLLRYNGVDSTVLRPPLNDPELFFETESEGYIIATGRVNAGKRQHLLVEALKYAPGVSLVVAGPPDNEEDAHRLVAIAEKEGVADRVSFELRRLPREELAGLVNKALAVAYLPFDEDSLGYCTMEALQASKPVITAMDSGGVLDIVRHGETGLVSKANPEELAAAMSSLLAAPAWARQLGRAGRQAMEGAKLSWGWTIEKLVS